MAIPKRLHDLFWDYDAAQLDWRADRDLIISRIVASGDWDSVSWLIKHTTSGELRRFFLRRRGRGVDPRRLRFWELVLGLPRKQVDSWLRAKAKDPWHRRRSR